MNVSNVIRNRVNDYLRDLDPSEEINFSVDYGTELLDEFLQEISIETDRYAFLTLVNNAIQTNVAKHVKKCKKKNCQKPEIAESYLYNLNNRKRQISRYEDGFSQEQLLAINSYLDDLSDRIDQQVKAEGEALELIQMLKQEIDELRFDMEEMTKRQASRQFKGTIYQTGKVLTLIGLSQEEIQNIIEMGLVDPKSIISNETLELVSRWLP